MERNYTMLCLGDSYTIGEAVEEKDSFPMQTVALLKNEGICFEKPFIIAKTGWTTDELLAAIQEEKLFEKFDFVTLLIGVNNQYRGRDAENYSEEFSKLLHIATDYAAGNNKHVFVLSIPDWGVTPFGEKDQRGSNQIGYEVDVFNNSNKEIASKAGVNYLDITPESKKAKIDPELTAGDGLHPTKKMYADWAEKLAKGIKRSL